MLGEKLVERVKERRERRAMEPEGLELVDPTFLGKLQEVRAKWLTGGDDIDNQWEFIDEAGDLLVSDLGDNQTAHYVPRTYLSSRDDIGLVEVRKLNTKGSLSHFLVGAGILIGRNKGDPEALFSKGIILSQRERGLFEKVVFDDLKNVIFPLSEGGVEELPYVLAITQALGRTVEVASKARYKSTDSMKW